MRTCLITALCASTAFASILPRDQQRLGTSASISHSKKPKVNSKDLMKSMKLKNLLARAEDFYEIAKLSQDEYNHPTRVIGSKGMPASFLSL